ncbi:MAG: 2-C-methyl-D-erythritol 2,4-cyclodiphosphate synthase [Dehalococcoidia bacterium]|nr:2-C-methyl-D-erythritol 2,4-cyclodiphosphate synthase [Dehalococcoidia bacterium]
MNLRVGVGYDLHRTAVAIPLMLGGVHIPYSWGLSGHSDGDAVMHAIADALLGAAGKGDIGAMFPPGDRRYAGITGRALLAQVRTALATEGWMPVNIDVTIIAEAPQLGPYRNAMRNAIAQTLEIPPDAVGIKAKTNEGLDAIGRGEAIAAHAVALIKFADG